MDKFIFDKYCKGLETFAKARQIQQLVTEILRDLVSKEFVKVYGFVVMPNHVHILWELQAMNGREMPHASFNKATAHQIVKDLKANHPLVLAHFKVDEKERQFRIWQRDPLAVVMDNKRKFEQKLNYIHNNPLAERWNLAKTPHDYFCSSASYYEKGIDHFSFLTHYQERFA